MANAIDLLPAYVNRNLFTTWTQEGNVQGNEFELVAQVVRDEMPDLDYLGYFSDEWEPGAIFHSDDSSQYRYFIPASNAPEEAERDYRRMVDYCDSQWTMVGIIVTAYQDGQEVATAVQWNLEADNADFSTVISDLALDAIYDAESKMRQCQTA